MAYHYLTDNFRSFFGRLNPSDTKIAAAASEHRHVTELIEDRSGPAAELAPVCFLQGSYKQQTAIHDINDVDVVALCRLWLQSTPGLLGSGRLWSRNDIFAAVAAALHRSPRYAGKIEYGPQSMCIKVHGAIEVEVLPVMFASDNYDPDKEPFKLFRPERQVWEDGYARKHQEWLSWKNRDAQTSGNFIPAIKVFKHLRTRFGHDVVSFHIECLLFQLADGLYGGAAPDYLANLLTAIARTRSAADWYGQVLRTPCGDRDVFTAAEWPRDSWLKFHELVSTLSVLARAAVDTNDREKAIELWQTILGKEYFPHL
jgi:hypothetical protein